eukprot:4437332-Pleurochrysis_carterae.AAC.1
MVKAYASGYGVGERRRARRSAEGRFWRRGRRRKARHARADSSDSLSLASGPFPLHSSPAYLTAALLLPLRISHSKRHSLLRTRVSQLGERELARGPCLVQRRALSQGAKCLAKRTRERRGNASPEAEP